MNLDLKREYKFENQKDTLKSNKDLEEMLILLNDKDYDVALGALERIKSIKITEKNLEIIKNGFSDAFQKASMPVKTELAKHIGFLDDRFCDVLINALDDNSSMVLDDVLHSLGYLKNPEVVPKIIQKLEHSSSNVRWACVSTLSNLITKKNKDLILSKIIEMLDDENHNVRSAAICVINNNVNAKFNNKVLIDALSRRLKENNDYMKQTSCYILGELSDPNAIPYLNELLNDYNTKYVEEEAKKSLKKLEKHKNNSDTKEKNPKSKE